MNREAGVNDSAECSICALRARAVTARPTTTRRSDLPLTCASATGRR